MTELPEINILSRQIDVLARGKAIKKVVAVQARTAPFLYSISTRIETAMGISDTV